MTMNDFMNYLLLKKINTGWVVLIVVVPSSYACAFVFVYVFFSFLPSIFCTSTSISFELFNAA